MPISAKNITALKWKRGTTTNGTIINRQRSKRTKTMIMIGVPFLAVVGTIMNYYFLKLSELGFGGGDNGGGAAADNNNIVSNPTKSSGKSWCDQVKQARSNLMPSLHIKYNCDDMMPATSAIVCMLTDGTSEEKATRVVFTAKNYINGAMALGASLQRNIDPIKTHQLLLLREGFTLDEDDMIRLQSVGWTLGTAPNFDLEPRYVPTFARYKTTYTKVTAIGLSEYECVMLMDADTLAVGDLRGVMSDCENTVFLHPANRVAGVLDLFAGRWKLFNTGSILWRTSSAEMGRVFGLSRNSSFMKKFSSDQAFLNAVYSEREFNFTLNQEIVGLDTIESRKMSDGQISPVVPHDIAQRGAVVPLSW
jgi:hypothetical protein